MLERQREGRVLTYTPLSLSVDVYTKFHSLFKHRLSKKPHFRRQKMRASLAHSWLPAHSTFDHAIQTAYLVTWEKDACNAFSNNSYCLVLVQWLDFRQKMTKRNATNNKGNTGWSYIYQAWPCMRLTSWEAGLKDYPRAYSVARHMTSYSSSFSTCHGKFLALW